MKLVGLVFLGLLASAVLYFPVFMLVSLVLGIAVSSSEGVMFLLAFFLVVPIAFLFGSMITGYFSYYDIDDKWALLWMAPALYCNLLWICVAGVQFLLNSFIGVNARTTGFLYGILVPFLTGLEWYLASLAGVRLGYYLRERFAKWWYGD